MEYLLNFLVILAWAVGICQERVTQDKRRWVMGGCLLLGALLASGFWKNDTIVLLINLLLVTIVYLILIEGEWDRKIAIYLFSNYYIEIFEEPMKLLVRMAADHYSQISFLSELMQTLLVIICIWIFAYEIRKSEKWVRWIKEEVPVKYYFIGFLCAFIATGLSVCIGIVIENKNRQTQILIRTLSTIVSIFFYLMGILIAVINSYREHYKRESALKDEYLRLSKKHYESLSNNIKEVRSLRHDMRAHCNAMAYFIEHQNWEKLAGYLEAVQEAADKSAGTFINVNHELVNAILTDALSGREDIAFQQEGILPSYIEVDDFDLCTIFSNLISNSLEACERLADTKKEILMEIKSLKSNLYIRMENPAEAEINVKKLGGWTTKTDQFNHGYGIYNIRTTVEKYYGDLVFQCENHRFSAEIVLWDVLK